MCWLYFRFSATFDFSFPVRGHTFMMLVQKARKGVGQQWTTVGRGSLLSCLQAEILELPVCIHFSSIELPDNQNMGYIAAGILLFMSRLEAEIQKMWQPSPRHFGFSYVNSRGRNENFKGFFLTKICRHD